MAFFLFPAYLDKFKLLGGCVEEVVGFKDSSPDLPDGPASWCEYFCTCVLGTREYEYVALELDQNIFTDADRPRFPGELR